MNKFKTPQNLIVKKKIRLIAFPVQGLSFFIVNYKMIQRMGALCIPRIIKWLVVLLVICPSVTFAELTDWVNYTHGNRVTGILNDGDCLWITTMGGLVRFNKVSGEKEFYNRGNVELPGNRLTGLTKDKGGNVWISSERGGIGRFDGIKTEVYNSYNSGLPSDACYDLLMDDNRNLWVSSQIWLCKYDGSHWQSWTVPGSDLGAYCTINDLKFDREGILWLAAYSPYWSFACFREGEIQVIPEIRAPVYSLEMEEGKIWLATLRGLMKYEDGSVTVYDTGNSEIPSNSVFDVKKAGPGYLWVASGRYLVKFDGATFQKIEAPLRDVADESDYVTCLEVDEDGTVWLGTRNSGMYRFKEEVFTQIDLSNSPLITNDMGFSMTIDKKDNLWFGTSDNLVQIDPENNWMSHFELRNGDAERRINAVAADLSGNLWVALGRSDTCVMKISEGVITAFTTHNSPLVSGMSDSHFYFDRKGNTWFGTRAGLFKYDGTDWLRFTPENSPLKSYQINCLATDRDDNLWGGSGDSDTGCLFKYDGAEWKIYTPENSGLPTRLVTVLTFDTHNVLWIHCRDEGNKLDPEASGGLTRFDGTTWQTWNTGNSDIPGNVLMDIQVDSCNTLWLATYDKGITRYDGREWTLYNTRNSGIATHAVSKITLDYYRDRIWFTHLFNEGVSAAKLNWNATGVAGKFAGRDVVFTLSPNPAQTTVHIQLEEGVTAGDMEICDSSGRIIARRSLSGSHIFLLEEIGAEQEGLYLVKVRTSKSIDTQKLLIKK